MYGCPQHWYRGACTNGLRIRQRQIEEELFGQLQRAVLQPEAIDRVLDQFMRQLKAAQADFSQPKERAQARKQELEEQVQRLTLAIAECGHSAALLEAITGRERELRELDQTLNPSNGLLGRNPDSLRAFVINQLTALPQLLALDVA